MDATHPVVGADFIQALDAGSDATGFVMARDRDRDSATLRMWMHRAAD
jgi:hypothetical protein